MGENHIHTAVEGTRVPGHHFIGGLIGALGTVGDALQSAGEAMEQAEQNFPRTMGLLDSAGSVVEEVMTSDRATPCGKPTCPM